MIDFNTNKLSRYLSCLSCLATNPSLLALGFCGMLCVQTGCKKSETLQAQPVEVSKVNEVTEPAAKDNEDSVKSLEKAGYVLKKNSAGNVTEFSVASQTEIADTFKYLSGLTSVTSATFTGPASLIRVPMPSPL